MQKKGVDTAQDSASQLFEANKAFNAAVKMIRDGVDLQDNGVITEKSRCQRIIEDVLKPYLLLRNEKTHWNGQPLVEMPLHSFVDVVVTPKMQDKHSHHLLLALYERNSR